MDFLEAGFRAKYERVCVGNLAAEDEDVFFEGLLCEEGLGEFFFLWIWICIGNFDCFGFFFSPFFSLPSCFLFSFFFLLFFFPFQSVGRGSADQTRGFGF